jgi:hypothetical protein
VLKYNICNLLLIVALAVSTAAAQKIYTPGKGSPERAAIFAALRVTVSKELKQSVSFLANDFKIQGNWAFINGQAQNPKGGAINWKITEYQSAIDDGVFDDNLSALLNKTGGKWRVVDHAIGCTDVCYLGWDTKHQAPSALFK